jgi:hypothetical protein
MYLYSLQIKGDSQKKKTHLNSIGLSVPHSKHITSPLQAQQVNTIYRFVTMVYYC